MLLREIISLQDRVFLKSEWGPISDEWSALSFTLQKVGRKLRAQLNPSRDVIVYVGTSDARFTQDERHRRRLLSVLRVEPSQIRATEDLVPRESWLNSQSDFRGRFLYSIPVVRAWEFDEFPLASEVIPGAYRSLGDIRYRGDVVEVSELEKSALLELSVHEWRLPRTSTIERIGELTAHRALSPIENRTMMRMERFISDPDDSVNGDIARMIALIYGRVAASGVQASRMNPYRSAPPVNTGLFMLLSKKWFAQNKRCALCMGRLVPNATNSLLQPSPDRVDSGNPHYDDENLTITHLGCNLAKNKFTVEEFDEWLQIVRGQSSEDLAGEVGVM